MTHFTAEVLSFGAPNEIIVDDGHQRWFVRYPPFATLPTLYAGDYVRVIGHIEGTDLVLADLIEHIDADAQPMVWI